VGSQIISVRTNITIRHRFFHRLNGDQHFHPASPQIKASLVGSLHGGDYLTERLNNGQFAKGNKGGPGRPHRQTEREYLAVLRDTVSLEDWKEIIEKTVAQAKEGDARARQWLTNYLVGDQPAKALLDLAVDEELGYDPIESSITSRKESAEWLKDFFPSSLSKNTKDTSN
jgi:hypothetical protein